MTLAPGLVVTGMNHNLLTNPNKLHLLILPLQEGLSICIGATTLSIMTLSLMTLSITTLSLRTVK
jgi:hypothetical protein